MHCVGSCGSFWQGGAGQCGLSSRAGKSDPCQGKVQGLKDESNYQLFMNEDFTEKYPEKRLPYGFQPGEVISGAALKHFGFVVPDAVNGFQAWQIHIKESVILQESL